MTFWVFVVFVLWMLLLAVLDLLLTWRWFRMLRHFEERLDRMTSGEDVREWLR